MSGMIGEMPRFWDEVFGWDVFIERLEQFLEVNDVPENKKKAILISCITDDAYKALRDVCHPDLPKNKSYEELSEILRKQFDQKTSVLRKRREFYNAKQTMEPISYWYRCITWLATDCKFGDQFDTILLDRFISGMRPSPILDRLCEEDDGKLTLQQALEIAVIKEATIKENSKNDDDEGETGGRKKNKSKKGRNKLDED